MKCTPSSEVRSDDFSEFATTTRCCLRIECQPQLGFSLSSFIMRSGKAPVSCIPCVKRKVRCDKQYPCCHCKRRPQDTCAYPSTAVSSDAGAKELGDRVAHLERMVRSLGGDPNGSTQPNKALTPVSAPSAKSSPQARSNQCAPTENHAPFDRGGLLAHNEEATYVES